MLQKHLEITSFVFKLILSQNPSLLMAPLDVWKDCSIFRSASFLMGKVGTIMQIAQSRSGTEVLSDISKIRHFLSTCVRSLGVRFLTGLCGRLQRKYTRNTFCQNVCRLRVQEGWRVHRTGSGPVPKTSRGTYLPKSRVEKTKNSEHCSANHFR